MKHVAIIPDGNRRWATGKGLAVTAGHEVSAQYDRLKELVEAAYEEGVRYFSLWAFSTENWKRSSAERAVLFQLLAGVTRRLSKTAVADGIRFRWLGRRDRIPEKLVQQLEDLEEQTRACTRMNVQLCLDYGGRDELVRAVNTAVTSGQQVTEQSLHQLLDTKGIPEPDMIIRTGGEQRLSGFMSYQAAYSELYFTQKFFPDFSADDLRAAINDFQSRERRYGGG